MYINEIRADDREAGRLFIENGLREEKNIDLLLGLYDDGELLATAGAFRNSLRLLAVKRDRQGEGLLSRLVGEVLSRQHEAGFSHIFCCTKAENAVKLREFGFFELIGTGDFVFMENRRNGLENYIKRLESETEEQKSTMSDIKNALPISAVVLKADPFTLGHRYLLELAGAKSSLLHLFIVREDRAHFSFDERAHMIKAGLLDMKNIIFHDTASYLISNEVFPQYFAQSDLEAAGIQAELDSRLFIKIAKRLSITGRFVGEEPFSPTTDIYNQKMLKILPKEGIELEIISRKCLDGEKISASLIRKLLVQKNFDKIKALVPKSSFDYIAKKYGFKP